jgi:hypothetical protein
LGANAFDQSGQFATMRRPQKGQRPLSVGSGPVQNPIGVLTFRIDYSKIELPVPIDYSEIDPLWKGLGVSVAYSALLRELEKQDKPDYFAGLFTQEDAPLYREVRQFISKFPKVIEREGFLAFVGLPILNPIELIRLMPPENGVLLNSAIHMISVILKNLTEHDRQQEFVLEFAKALSPEEIVSPAVVRDYIRYPVFIPVSNFEHRLFWLVMARDQSTLVIPFDGLSETLQGTPAQVRAKNDKIVVNGVVFSFLSAEGIACWNQGKPLDDPLLQFLNCLHGIRPYLDSLPKEFTQQVIEAIGAPDLVLATALGESVPPQRKDTLWHLYTALTHSEALTSFFRSSFARDIGRLNDPNRVYRDNSLAMGLTGIILRGHGHDMVDELLRVFEENPAAGPVEIFEKWMPFMESASQTNRIILHIAFTAARRRFPNGIVPMTAISGVLMLRHILAEIGSRLGSASQLQQVMNLTVFRATMKETQPDHRMFRVIAEFLLGLTILKDNSVPKDSFTVLDLLCVVLEVLDGIISYVSSMPKPPVPLVAYTVQDLIETFFTGPDEDPRDRINAYYSGE